MQRIKEIEKLINECDGEVTLEGIDKVIENMQNEALSSREMIIIQQLKKTLRDKINKISSGRTGFTDESLDNIL